MKKVLRTAASVCVSVAAICAMATVASAEAIDFEDGNYSFASVRTDDGGDLSVLSVEEFNGSKQLKVDVQDCSLLPKILFDMNAIVGTDNLSDVDKILMDVTFASKDGTTAPGWSGGCIGTTGSNDTSGREFCQFLVASAHEGIGGVESREEGDDFDILRQRIGQVFCRMDGDVGISLTDGIVELSRKDISRSFTVQE